MVAAAVIRIFVANGTYNREFVGGLGEIRHHLAELHAGNRGGDRLELAANLRRRIGLGIERLVMRWPAIEPDQNAINLLATGLAGQRRRPCGIRSQPEQIRQPESQQTANAELQEVSTLHSGAVASKVNHCVSQKLIIFPVICEALILDSTHGSMH
jgi:hypothetical protein